MSGLSEILAEFLRTGKLSNEDTAWVAAELMKRVHLEVQRSAVSGLKLARRFVRLAQPFDITLRQAAYRSLGWAYHANSRYRRAEQAYLQARNLVTRRSADRARIDRILIDIYMYLGDSTEARRRARLALNTFARLGNKVEEARTRVNVANLLHRQDRHEEAAELYRLAGKTLQAAGDTLSVASCYYNEANVLVQLFRTKRAGQLYQRAEKLFDSLGYDLYSNECRYGMTWLRMLQGDYHQAIRGLVDCEEGYRRANHLRGIVLCRVDCAEAYLNLNLWTDARHAAHQAELLATRLGMIYEASKASFYRAKAAYAIGNLRESKNALQRAHRGFEREKNGPFLSAVNLFASLSNEGTPPNAAQLRRAGRSFARSQLPLWDAICDLQLLAIDLDDAAALNRLGENPAVRAVPHLFAQWHTMLGDRHAEQGELRIAENHWGKAVLALEKVRAKLPPVDLRSTFLQQRSDPYSRMVNATLEKDPAQAAVWSERQKTAGLWMPLDFNEGTSPTRKKAAESLHRLAQQVTAIASRISNGSDKRSTPSMQSLQALEDLQEKVRYSLTAVEPLRGAARESTRDLIKGFREESQRQTIVQYQYDNEDLVALVHVRGDTHVHRYRGGRRRIKEYIGWWQVMLSRQLSRTGQLNSAYQTEEDRLFTEMANWLWKPLEVPARPEAVLVLPESGISNLPWQALVIDGDRLGDRHSIVVAPSLRHHRFAGHVEFDSRRVEVFVGEPDGLRHTRDEVSAFSDMTDGEVVIHDPCTRNDWPSHSSARVWHYTGHAHNRSDNPFYSSLTLSEGPLFAADFRLRQNRVKLVTLAACRTGRQTFMPGEESVGLVRSLLEMGARNVVASHWSIDDLSSSIWMRTFYSKYFAGSSVHESARAAAGRVRMKYPSVYHWAAFSIFGAR